MSGAIPFVDPAVITLQGGGTDGVLYIDPVTIAGKSVLRVITPAGLNKYVTFDSVSKAIYLVDALG